MIGVQHEKSSKIPQSIESYLYLTKRKGRTSVEDTISFFKKNGFRVSRRNAQRDLKDLAGIMKSKVKCRTVDGKKLYFYGAK